MQRVCCWLVGLFLLVLLIPAPLARAEEPGVVTGRLANGTAGGPLPAGAEIVLHVFRGEAHQVDRVARIDEQGGFRFDGLEVGEVLTYQLTAAYQGASYSAAPLRLTATAPERQVEIKVFEATAVDPGLRAIGWLLVVGEVSAERQEIAIMELVTLTNPSDRTFAPKQGGGGPGEPMGAVRFGLPPGAGELRPSLGLDPSRVIQVDRGFASIAPVPPGEHELGYSYRFPYTGDRYRLENSLPYGAADFRLLVPDNGLELASPGLTAGEPVVLGGTRFRVWTGRDLAPGARLTLELRGLPARPPWRAALDVVAQPLVAPAMLALVLVLGAGWLLRARRVRTSIDARHAPAADRETLLTTLADLDDAFAAGEIPEPTYRERRATLKATLRALHLSRDQLSPVTPAETHRR